MSINVIWRFLPQKICDDNEYGCEWHMLAKDTLGKKRVRKLGNFAIEVLYSKIRAIKGKYAQIRVIKPKYSHI